HLSMRDTFLTFAPTDWVFANQALATVEGSSDVTVTSPNAFQIAFLNTAGGHPREFYDLAESPTIDAVHDLAGGSGGQIGLFLDEIVLTSDGSTYRSDKNIQ